MLEPTKSNIDAIVALLGHIRDQYDLNTDDDYEALVAIEYLERLYVVDDSIPPDTIDDIPF